MEEGGVGRRGGLGIGVGVGLSLRMVLSRSVSSVSGYFITITL